MEETGRRALSLVVAIATLLGLGAQPAAASELHDIEVTSRFVNPVEEPWDDVPERPPAPHANVLLPDDYDADKPRGYPVLYLLHGATGSYRSWERDSDVAEAVAGFPGIIVMPDGGAFGMYTDWYNRGAFGRPGWMSHHLIELRREIERRFPIRSGRRWHAIAGVSMGGMGAVRYAAAAPGYFGSAAAFSGASLHSQAVETFLAIDAVVALAAEGTTYGDIWGPPDGYYAEANNPLRLIPNLQHTRLYITSGDGTPCPGDPAYADPLEAALRWQADIFVDAVDSAGVDVTGVHTCGGHTNQTTRRALAAALEWGFFEPVQKPAGSWTYITASPRGEMHDLRFRFAAQPTTVIRFERDGTVLRGEGSGTVRIRRGRRCVVDVTLPFEVEVPRHCER